MRQSDDTDFDDVNGVRFDRLRAVGAFALIEALRALREPHFVGQREALRAVIDSLELTPPEEAFALSVGFERTIDILADAASITWGQVMQAMAQRDATDARIDDMES